MLSVIIPVYNAKRYIAGIVEAFSIQELPEAELVFVDDGSTDGSFEAITQLQAPSYITVTAVRQENQGVSAARNHGIRAAHGDWIVFMDADDRFAPDFGVVAKQLMQRGDADVFLYRHRAVENWADAARIDAAPAEFSPVGAEELLRSLMITPTRFGVYDVLIRREFLLEKGLRFAEGYPYYEDYEFLYRLFLAGGRIRQSEHALYDYHANHASVMAAFSDERVRCLCLYDALQPLMPQALRAEFSRWGRARIMWSVLWQASVVKPDFAAFRTFAAETGAAASMAALTGFPEKRVAWSARLFGISPRAYRALARLAAGRRQKKRLHDAEATKEDRGAER